MEKLQIDVLNPKAKKILRNLADLNLIKINKIEQKTDFTQFIEKLRVKTPNEISLEEITNEVELVRRIRYEKL
uniref:hypothetical protein n=1 Tax=Flavobacterium sp. TaxID=239 RepID=UPI0040498BF0